VKRLALLPALLLAVSTASAQDLEREVKRLVRQAHALASKGRYDVAIKEFEKHFAEIDCKLVLVLTDRPRILRLLPDEVEVLARLEHERWRREKRHPSVNTDERNFDVLNSIPWGDCLEEVKQFNRDMAAAMPTILAKADFEIRRNE